MKPVTDPALLAQLEGQFAQRQAPPEVAVQLNAQLAEQAFEQEAAKGEQWELSEEATATPTLDAIEGGAQDFKTGLASSGVKTALGLKQLFGAEGDLDATMQQLVDEDMDETGMWGTVGSVVGDLGQMAVPGAAVARAGRAVTAGGCWRRRRVRLRRRLVRTSLRRQHSQARGGPRKARAGSGTPSGMPRSPVAPARWWASSPRGSIVATQRANLWPRGRTSRRAWRRTTRPSGFWRN